jgi:hypothetical protein
LTELREPLELFDNCPDDGVEGRQGVTAMAAPSGRRGYLRTVLGE